MKKYMICMIVAVFAFIAALPTPIKAAELGNNVVISDNKDGSADVSLTMPNAAREQISTLKVTLNVEPKNTGDDSVVFTFAPAIEENTKVHEYRYHSGTSRLTIYVADSDALFAEGENTILLGTIKADSQFKVSVEPDAVSAVVASKEEAAKLDDYPTVTIGEDNADPDRPDTEAIAKLEEKISEAEGIAKGDYTDSSYNALLEALENAKKVLNDPMATAEEIAQALADLENAIGALELVQKDSAQDKLEQDVADQKVKDPNIASENTGDSTNIWPYVTVTVMSGVIIAGFVYWKQKEKGSQKH